MFRTLSRAAIVPAILLLTQACTSASVLQGNPRPNIDLPQREGSLALAMEEAVQDQYSAEVNGTPKVSVSGWRTTLQNGFNSGFSSAFKLATDKADLTLQISEAVLSFAPTAVGRYGAITAAEAQLRYKARLLDAQGQVLRRSMGTVTSKRSVTESEAVTNAAADAVESMYEKIAQDCFSEAPAPTPASASTPAQ